MMNPKVSVIMPAYNQAQFLRQAVDSVLGQTMTDLELIVVNDCSTDQTAETLSLYNDGRLTVIHHEQNQGASAAMNTGFAQARGEYLTWLASDNVYNPEFLEKTSDFLDKKPDVGFVYSSFRNVDESGRFLDYAFLNQPYPGFLRVDPGAVGVAFLYRREVMSHCGDYKDLVCNDLDYWLCAARKFNFAFIPEVLADNRKHGAMQTVVKRDQLAREVAAQLEAETRETKSPDLGTGPFITEFRRSGQKLVRMLELAHPNICKKNLVVVGEPPFDSVVSALLKAHGFKTSTGSPRIDALHLPLDNRTEQELSEQNFEFISLSGQGISFGTDF